jgi:hypothetical protein
LSLIKFKLSVNKILPFVLFTIYSANSQDIGLNLNPLPNDSIKNQELFIAFQLDTTIKFKPSELSLFIDELNFSPLIKYKNNKLTALITNPLKPGKHTIKVRLITESGKSLKQEWDIFVVNENKMKKKYPEMWEKYKPKKKDFGIKGSASYSARFSDVTGEGAALRQEPPQTHEFRLDGGISYKNYTIPFKFFFTNHDKPGIPPRNRLMLSVKGKKAGIVLGDANPTYDRLVLNGSRIRGGEAYLSLRYLKFNVAYGDLNRSNEGQVAYWDISQGFQPVNMQLADSSYIKPGTYKRNLAAFNMELLPPNSQNKFKFTIVRSSDVLNSIEYGGPAEQNIAFSLSSLTIGREKKWQIDIGAAVSFTTKDIRRGAVSQEEFQETYKRELRVDPLLWEDIYIVNSTTVPTTTQDASFLGFYVNSKFNVLKQNFTLNFERLGSAFESFGNPYLQNDRYNVMFQDRIPIWKRKINLMLQYRYNEDNLSEIKAIKNATHQIGSNLTMTFGPKIPTLIGGYRIFIREGISVQESSVVQDMQVTNYSAGLTYSFKTGEFTHGLNIVFNRNSRENFKPVKSRTDNDVLNFGFTEAFPYRINLSFQYNHLLLANDTSNLTEQRTIGFRLSYTNENKKIKISAGGNQISALETDFYPESTRQVASIDAEYAIIKNGSIKLQIGNSTYKEPGTTGRNYNENWGQLALRYDLK